MPIKGPARSLPESRSPLPCLRSPCFSLPWYCCGWLLCFGFPVRSRCNRRCRRPGPQLCWYLLLSAAKVPKPPLSLPFLGVVTWSGSIRSDESGCPALGLRSRARLAPSVLVVGVLWGSVALSLDVSDCVALCGLCFGSVFCFRSRMNIHPWLPPWITAC